MDVRRRILADWLDYRRRPPTPANLLQRHARAIVQSVGVLLAGIAAQALIGHPYWTGGAIGFGLAMLLHLAQQIRVASLTWPVASEFLDWSRVEQAAREAGVAATSGRDGMVE